MTQKLETMLPVIMSDGLATDKAVAFGSTLSVVGTTTLNGNVVLAAGKTITGGVNNVISGSGATVTLTAAQSGSTFLFDRAAGIVVTLPAPAVGLTFTFLTTVSVTSNNATVITDVGTTFILGSIESLTVASAVTFASVGNGTSHVKVQSNGTTTGGLQGGAYNLTCISSTVWFVEGFLVGSGTLATPFA